MQELTYCHPPFGREQRVRVLTERSHHLLHTGSAAGGAGTGSKARILVFPLLTPLLGCHGKGAPAHWSCTPRKTFCCINKAGNSVPRSSPGTYIPLEEVHGQLEICPTPPWSQGCREPGPGPSMGLWRRRCASPSFGLMKTSVTSETLFVLTGIVI